jgi:DNA-binding transcriptional regulator GbsR (MarR family)
MQFDPVTQAVVATLTELGAAEPTSLVRTVLLRDGYFVGYQFHCGDRRAVWFVESGVIKFHDAQGKLLRKIDPNESLKKAAA